MRARRANVLPALVLIPWRRRSPREYSLGVSPRSLMSCLGFSKRVRSPEFSHEGDGHGELDAAHRLEGLDDGGETPVLDLLSEFSLKALESFVMFSHGPDILLAND